MAPQSVRRLATKQPSAKNDPSPALMALNKSSWRAIPNAQAAYHLAESGTKYLALLNDFWWWMLFRCVFALRLNRLLG
eukprot:scaffold1182_cov165-Amphora_coffeaeformis.AAC.10